jgi:hypothetical protein
MGYATVQRVPQLRNYADALKKHDETKPIRGRAEEIKPLGDRRDAGAYSIRKNGEAVELVLYKTPVITFEPSGEVVLFVDNYNTVATHQFISHVLGISASGVRHTTVLVIGGNKYTLAKQDKLRLRRDEGGNWCVLNPTQQWSWQLDRKAVTNVRSKYGEFYKYLKGFVNLRTETLKTSWSRIERDYVLVQQSELKSVFGNMTSIRSYAYMDKLGKQSLDWQAVKPEQYAASSNAFEVLIRPDQPEEGKHTNFYKAALLLVAKSDTDKMDIRTDEVQAPAKHIVPLLDEVLFQMNAHYVLIRKELPQGKVSTGRYERWMQEWEEAKTI